MKFDCKQRLAGLKKALGSKRNRRSGGRRSNRSIQMEQLERRALMAAVAGDAAVADRDIGDAETVTESRSALVGERFPDVQDTRNVASNDRVGIAPLPTPYPDPDKLPGREDPVSIAPLPSPHPRPINREAVDTVMSQELGGFDDLYTLRASSSTRTGVVGIAPLPSPHPRPDSLVDRVGIEPNPTP